MHAGSTDEGRERRDAAASREIDSQGISHVAVDTCTCVSVAGSIALLLSPPASSDLPLAARRSSFMPAAQISLRLLQSLFAATHTASHHHVCRCSAHNTKGHTRRTCAIS